MKIMQEIKVLLYSIILLDYMLLKNRLDKKNTILYTVLEWEKIYSNKIL